MFLLMPCNKIAKKCFALLNKRANITTDTKYLLTTITSHVPLIYIKKKFTEVFPMMPFSKSTHMVCSIPLPVPLPQNYKIAKNVLLY